MVAFKKIKSKFWWSSSFLGMMFLVPSLAYADHSFQNTIQRQDLEVFKLNKPSFSQGFSFNGCTNSSTAGADWTGKKCDFSLKITDDYRYPSEVMLIVQGVDNKQKSRCIADLKVDFMDTLEDPNGFVEKLSDVSCQGKFSGMNLKQIDKTHYQLMIQ